MKKSLFVLCAALFALCSRAQDEDSDGYSYFYCDSVVGTFDECNAKTMDVAFEASSSMISSVGTWYHFSYTTLHDRRTLMVTPEKWLFKADGTGSASRPSSITVDYQNVKRIDLQIIIPMTWKKVRDNFICNLNTAKQTTKFTNSNQVKLMSAREKYDIEQKLKATLAMGGIIKTISTENQIMKYNNDIIIMKGDILMGDGSFYFISQSGINKLKKKRAGYNIREAKRIAEEKTRLEEKAKREAEENAKKEAEWIARIEAEGGKIYEVNGVKFAMVRVEGGAFEMGGSKYDEIPIHKVTLNSFFISETEVTQELWEAVMGNNPSYFKGKQLPVESVTWDDCQAFIAKLNQLTGQQFRLPSEAEWEYAARGGKYCENYTYSGSNDCNEVAWFADNGNSQTHEVASKAPNKLGIYDMTGNIAEWCYDWYDKNYYSSSSLNNPTGPENGYSRILRGGSWSNMSTYTRVVYRGHNLPLEKDDDIGFRLAL